MCDYRFIEENKELFFEIVEKMREYRKELKSVEDYDELWEYDELMSIWESILEESN